MPRELADEPTPTQSNPQQTTNDQLMDKHKSGQAAIARLRRPVRARLALAQALMLVSVAFSIGPYVALVALGETLLRHYQDGSPLDVPRITVIVNVFITSFFARILFMVLSLLVTHLADLRLRDQTRRDLLERFSRAPLGWFTETTSGRIRKTVQDDTVTVHTVIAHAPVDVLNAVATPVVLLCYALYLDWRLGLLSVATVPLYLGTYSIMMRTMPTKTAEMDGKLARLSSTMLEFASGIAVVKTFGQTGRAHSAYTQAAKEFNNFYRAWSTPLLNISCLAAAWVCVPLILLVNLGVGSLLVSSGSVSVPRLLCTTLIALAIPEVMDTVATIQWSYQLAGSAAVRLCEMLDLEVLPQPALPDRPRGSTIEVSHVTHVYGEGERAVTALDDVTLTFPEGTVTALLGPSGSGKSTLGALLARFADPTRGTITLGGVALRSMDEETLYSHVSFVLQDAQLLTTSVRKNIALARPDATDEEVIAAARSANIHDFIQSLPAGYGTVIGEQTHVSGGQAQRIAIARALLRDAPVLVLDEATAMVDPESEAEIQQALTRLARGRTVVVIAHRPAVIAGADQVVVLEHGRVRAVGTHDELVDDPHYSLLLAQALHQSPSALAPTAAQEGRRA